MRVRQEAGGNLVVWSASPAETEELGKVLGGILLPGDLFFLSGDLGSGKTLLVRGLPAAGQCGDGHQSHFALIHRYEGKLPFTTWTISPFRPRRLGPVGAGRDHGRRSGVHD